MHTCNLATPEPHEGGLIAGPGCPSVMIGGLCAAVEGDLCICNGPPNAIAGGSSTVLIGGRPAARLGDATAHGGKVVTGCATVLIGDKLSDSGKLGESLHASEFSEENKKIIIKETISKCMYYLREKIRLISENDIEISRQFKKWFGQDSEEAKSLIVQRIKVEIRIFEQIGVSNFIEIGDENERSKTYAWVFQNDNSHKIYLGDLFWSAPKTGKNSKAGVLIHELSHFLDIGSTEDCVYGERACLEYAKKIPAGALYNADSFEYFIVS